MLSKQLIFMGVIATVSIAEKQSFLNDAEPLPE